MRGTANSRRDPISPSLRRKLSFVYAPSGWMISFGSFTLLADEDGSVDGALGTWVGLDTTGAEFKARSLLTKIEDKPSL